jgi:hypothetical protein
VDRYLESTYGKKKYGWIKMRMRRVSLLKIPA